MSIFSEVWLHGCLRTRLLMLSIMDKVRMTYDLPEGPWKVQNVHFLEVWLHGCLGTRLLMLSTIDKVQMTHVLSEGPEGPEYPFFPEVWLHGCLRTCLLMLSTIDKVRMTHVLSEGPGRVQKVQNIHSFRSMASWVSTNSSVDAEYDRQGPDDL
jgi:hypothetical protein